MTKHHQDAEKLLVELLAIPGRAGRERKVMDFLVKRLRKAGAPAEAIQFDQAHRRSRFPGEVGNLALKLPGTIRGPRRMLVAHSDTVPLCEGARPVRRGDRIVPADKHTALGADDRTGTSVLLATALRLLREKPDHPPLTFLWTVQEEFGLQGVRNLRLGMLGRPRLAFNFDGGSPEKITVGATGGYRMEIRITGIPAHAGNAPQNGVSAIAIAGIAIERLHREGWHGLVQKNGRRGTSNVGIIRGGDAGNVVASEVTLRAEARSHTPTFRRRIVREIERAFREATGQVRNAAGQCGRVRFAGRLDYEAFKLPAGDPSVRAAITAIRRLGGEPITAVTNGGLDANWLTHRGIPTVSLGCGQENMHTTEEAVNLPEFRRACDIAMLLATDDL